MPRSPGAGGDVRRAGRRRPAFLRAFVLALLAATSCERAGFAVAPPLELAPPERPDAPESWKPHYRALAALGDGFVAWETKRTGRWRIWMRPLGGGPERQLSPEEPNRDHVAVHISPDGRHAVYLSLPAPHESFDRLPDGAVAPLHLLRIGDDGAVSDRVLAPNARPYHQSRAAVWVNARQLIYIAGDATTRQIDIATGEEELLLPRPSGPYGMLVNATRTYASNDRPTFSVYHPEDRSVAPRKALSGCQPYFTIDGELGYWMGDGGGPVRKLDLRSRSIGVVLERNSKFLPEDRRYVYFPMASADRRLLAFAASKNEHGHFTADYEIFVAPLDPEGFAVRGAAVRYSFAPGPDRFPDVFVAGTELGRHRGEAPLPVAFQVDPELPAEGWSFDFGDGTPPSPTGAHVFERAGRYRVTARGGGRVLGGDVRVEPGAPPVVLRAEVQPGGRQIAVVFDEPVDLGEAKASLESGAKVEALARGDRPHELRVSLAEPLVAEDTLTLEGVADRAPVPHRTPAPVRLTVAMSAWPGPGEGLAFAYATEGAANRARDLDTGHLRDFSLVPHGRARFDAHGALRLDRGWFEVEDLPQRFDAAFREANAFTLELTVWPRQKRSDEPLLRIVSLASEATGENLSLSQHGARASLRVRTTGDSPESATEVEFGKLVPGKPQHLLVSYRPGRLVAYQDGRQVLETDALKGDLASWLDGSSLALGADPDGGRDFRGTLEGVALYHRPFEPAEAAAHAKAYRELVKARERVPRTVVKARLVSSSVLPTPEQIAPYREALVLNEYELPPKKARKLGGPRVRVAHWAILDGRDVRIPAAKYRGRVKLVLEPFERYSNLESTYLADTLEPAPDVPLYLDVH